MTRQRQAILEPAAVNPYTKASSILVGAWFWLVTLKIYMWSYDYARSERGTEEQCCLLKAAIRDLRTIYWNQRSVTLLEQDVSALGSMNVL